jgi:hypothetical protein
MNLNILSEPKLKLAAALKKQTNLLIAVCCIAVFCSFSIAEKIGAPLKNQITIIVPKSGNNRIKYGAEKLGKALTNASFMVQILTQDNLPKSGKLIVIGTAKDQLVGKANGAYQTQGANPTAKGGFSINSSKNGNFIISGFDNSGALYGCLELADRVKATGALPEKLALTDQPEMVQRGACIGVQKPALLPGRGVYEYPYTPETFPWFYDKALWIKYLDMLVENRMNSLYLWNGHPFSSLVKVKEYPYAVEVDDATFKKNEDIYRFLTEEADKRGIWVIQGFYNIIIPKPFAEKHHLKTQDRNRPIIPLIADYTRKSIAAFVEKYPNVGLLITLGEAMEGVGQDDTDWFTKTIIPGVKDGLKALGRTDEPPIVLRAHDSDAPTVMKYAKPLYKNLYTMAKYNGEALTTYTPRGSWAELHRTLSRIGTVQIENVHILANLEPFRYGSADFIQKSVLAMHSVYEANGLHLYPQASYWDWPYTADKTNPRELQIDRDWLWYAEWSRYAWNSKRNREDEVKYWATQLAKKYNCTEQQGENILAAYEQAGEIEPKLLRRYGITDGNRQTLTLGMFMSQLISPKKFGLFTLMYDSEAPEGEMIIQYAEKEWKKQPHVGETPVQIANEVQEHGKKAVEAIDRATSSIKKDREEFERLKNDMYCQKALADFYAEKARAALLILRYKYSNQTNDLEQALPHLQKSVQSFKELTDLTKNTYLYANSMQTQQRKIPIGGNDGRNKTWTELLPQYEQELKNFEKNISQLKLNGKVTQAAAKPFENAAVTLLSKGGEFYNLVEKQTVFTDTAAHISELAPALIGLKAIRFSRAEQIANGTTVQFKNAKPVTVLVGFFTTRDKKYLKPSDLETDASANDYGQAEVKIGNAMVVESLPLINIHTYTFPAGTNTLTLAKGGCLVLGIINSQDIKMYNAALGDPENKDVDWLFN